ncbi:MAG: hypothetical protein MI864_13045 [Pseudomonadales bacterium]|nr:hypothetical protein [Pseudomonadales bacterium]
MSDKNWMLNPSAIRAARTCIQITQEELDIKLKLSHPQFIELLGDYVELTESDELLQAYEELLNFAGETFVRKTQKVRSIDSARNNVAAFTGKSAESSTNAPNEYADAQKQDMDELIEYCGRTYRRFEGDLEFKGLYRGQPRYA